ncbi:MAG: ImmA/IrrE family metallo-endopeptidase [Clostridium sp.]|jgi:predicted transcriptional regulator|nr:ImmA/IrrE family metallo-endopeptidase [Clostridium sp.]
MNYFINYRKSGIILIILGERVTLMDVQIIEKYASRIHDALQLEDNFDIIKVVTGLGGILEEGPLNSGVVAQLTDLSDTGNEPKFKIQTSDLIVSEARKRFSIAHELGHLFIHLGFLESEKWSENCKKSIVYHREEMSTGMEETEANTFAAAFLMPAEQFRRVADNNFDENDGYNIEEIANKFNVSRVSAYYRGVNLGIWIQ